MKENILDRIKSVRDEETRKIIYDLESGAGVNIFYRFTKRESIELNPDKRFSKPRYSPRQEVGRKSNFQGEKLSLFGSAITNYGNWIKMEEKGYLEPEIKKAGLDLDRVIYARDWDVPSEFTENYYSGGEIIGITAGVLGGRIHTSPIKFTGSENLLRLTCGFDFYSITDNNKLQRDKFTAVVGSPAFGCFGNYFVSDIKPQREVCGSNNKLLRSTSRIMNYRGKNPFDKKAWAVYEKVLSGDRK